MPSPSPRLAFVALLVFLAPAAGAQDPFAEHPIVHTPSGVHVVTMGPDGTVSCDHAEEAAVAEQMNARRPGVRLTAVSSTNPVGSTNFRIILRATDQLLAQPEALLSFRRAAARWERVLQSEVTTVIDVDYGTSRFGQPYPSPNILGSTGSAIRFTNLDPAAAVQRFKSLTDDPQLIGLYNAIPVPTPSTLRGTVSPNVPLNLSTMQAGTIPLQVYGILPARLSADTPQAVPSIGFNSAFNFDFDPRNGISSSQIDFEGVVVHEIGHALGYVSAIGSSAPNNPVFYPWDLFRVRPDAVQANESLGDGQGWERAERVVTPGPVETRVLTTIEGIQFFVAVQVFFDGLNLYETSTATGGREGGDGQQASHWRDDARRDPRLGPQRKIGIMDPNSGFGELGVITDADVRMLEVIGYSVDYDPSTAEAQYALDGEVIDTEAQVLLTRSFALDAVDPGETGTGTLTVSNLDDTNALDYEIEYLPGRVVSTGTPPSVTVTLSNAAGTIPPGGSADVTVRYSASGAGLFDGKLLLRSNDASQYVVDLPIAFAVGGASFPALRSSGLSREVIAESRTRVEIDVQNPSDLAALGYLRILEPALSVGAPGFAPDAQAGGFDERTLDVSGGAALAAAGLARSRGARASAELPGATFPFAITEVGDGRLLVSDLDLTGATSPTLGIFVVSEDLASVTKLPAPFADDFTTGLAYDEREGTVWFAYFQTDNARPPRLQEATFGEGGFTFTGRQIDLRFRPTSLSYSAELDALFVTPNAEDRVFAYRRDGSLLPGYPRSIPAIEEGRRRNAIVSQSFREGVLEVSGFQNELRQHDQFGRDFPSSETVVFEPGGAELMGAHRFLAYVRSRVDFNRRAYYVLDQADDASPFFVIDVDPPDFPARVGTVLDAVTPSATSGALAPSASATLAFELDTRGRSGEEIDEVLAYLTNNPSEPIVTLPIDLSVRPVVNEGRLERGFEVVGAVPNPVARTGGAIRIRMAQAGALTVEVFNVLGQRVAVLARDAPVVAGTHDLPLDAGGLAAGTYLVRVRSGEQVGTKSLTVVR